jgi:Lar family restriction alleviation protein
MASKLNNCPFCGHEALIITNLFSQPTIYYVIKCSYCIIETDSTIDKEKLILQWNTRQNSEKYEKLLNFAKQIRNGFCFTDTDYQGLEKLVKYENEAERILKEIGEE